MKRFTHFLIFCFLCGLFLSGTFRVSSAVGAIWGKPESPAVVNPAVRSTHQQFISLSGDWDFALGNWFLRWRMGKDEPGWDYSPTEVRKIQVPGCWEAQGFGHPGPNQTWDPSWDCPSVKLRHQFMGAANYQRKFELPAEWAGKRIWLKIGGVRTDAYVWVNRKKAAYVNNFCGTVKFDISDLVRFDAPNEITAFVRNDTPSRKGGLSAIHSFGGFYRDIELEATAEAWLDDVWVRSNFEKRAAEIRFAVRFAENPSPKESSTEKTDENLRPYRVQVRILDADGKIITEKEKETPGMRYSENDVHLIPLEAMDSLTLPIPNAKLWTPEMPNLYLAEVTLLNADGEILHGWSQRFGLREFKVVGNRFFLNGIPYFLRGCGDHFCDVLNLVYPPSRKLFRETLTRFKAAGFNFARHHTRFPHPEYFDAADEIGLLLMPELPYYHDVPTEGFTFDPLRDIQELFQTYRRHVSFAAYSTGNEGFLGDGIDLEVYRWARKNDPERVFQHQDGGKNTAENSDFFSPNGYGLPSSILPWEPGAFAELEKPFVAHEYLNLSIKPNPYLENRYSGAVLPPASVQKRLEDLAQCGLDETWGKRCLKAGERLQAFWQKQGIEQARRDPDCDGYAFWSITDAGAASQGYLTQFNELRENAWTLEQFRAFNGPTVLLLETEPDSQIVTAGQKIRLKFLLSHFDAYALNQPTLRLKLLALADGEEKILAENELTLKEIPAGTLTNPHETEFELPEIESRKLLLKAELITSCGKLLTKNQWNFWCFAKREKPELDQVFASPALFRPLSKRYSGLKLFDENERNIRKKPNSLLIAESSDLDEISAAINAGMRILVISPASPVPDVKLGWWSLGTQIGTAFELPETENSNPFSDSEFLEPLWFRLVRKGGADLKKPTFLGRLEPLAVGEGADSWFLYLGQAKIQNARVLGTFALALLEENPEALAFLDYLIHYARSEKFHPKTESKFTPPKSQAPPGMILGFKELLNGSETYFGTTYFSETAPFFICRQDQIGNRLDWLTDPIPQTSVSIPKRTKSTPETADSNAETKANAETKVPPESSETDQTLTFTFAGMMGYLSQPQTEGFRLLVNEKEVLRFDLTPEERKETVWHSTDGKYQLRFLLLSTAERGEDRHGKFFLTIPETDGKTGERLKLSVESLGNESRRWFGLCPHRNLL